MSLHSERVAISVLKRNDWNLEAGVDAFFAMGMGTGASAAPRVDSAKIGQLFETYKGGRPQTP